MCSYVDQQAHGTILPSQDSRVNFLVTAPLAVPSPALSSDLCRRYYTRVKRIKQAMLCAEYLTLVLPGTE